MLLRAGTAAFVLAALSLPASAHIQLSSPSKRYTDQKVGPCGRANGARTNNVTELAPGSTLTVTWNETIDHPGHFRIAFDDDGTDDFINPATATDFNNSPAVLVDNIPDTPGGGESSVEVTLPDIECDNCTLQLIQVMTTSGPIGNDDLYWQCADLRLTNNPSGDVDAGPDDGGDGDSGCSASGSSASLAGLLLAFAALLPTLLRARRGH
jgi:hypothetical protein